VSAELRSTAQLETDLRVQGAEALARGENAAVYDLAADQMAADRVELEASNADYEAWSDSTAQTRESAEKAQRELGRRGYQVLEWTPENESPERQADEPEGQADAPEREADMPEVEVDEPVMPEPEVNEPGAASSTSPEPEPGMV
jgi:nucleotide-binding universal stress UspA family protein